jgi:WhiB family redox-sensing transcriptional regulator
MNLEPIHATRAGGVDYLEMLAAAILTPEPWVQDALCAQVDPELWFPERGASNREAKAICEACDVRLQCLEYSIRNKESWGTWGGVGERDRRRLRRGEPIPPPKPRRLPSMRAGYTLYPWSEADDQYLRDNFKHMSDGALAHELDRTINAVHVRRSRLHLDRRYRRAS